MSQRRRSRHQIKRRIRHFGETPSSGNLGASPQRPSTGEPLSDDLELLRSIAEGLSALDCFTPERQMLSLHELAQELHASIARARVYVSTLVSHGFLEQADEYNFKLGPSAVNLGLSFLHSLPIAPLALGPLRELRDLTGHTASLAILSETDIVYVNRIRGHREGQYEVDLELRTGARLPLHHTAAGTLLLAHLEEAEQNAVIADLRFDASNPASKIDEKNLRSRLAEIRSDGLAVYEAELSNGLCAISGPVHDSAGAVIAAIELAGPGHSRTMREFIQEFGQPLRSACLRLSDLLAADSSFSESRIDAARSHEERALEMYALYQGGATFEQVGEQFGIPHDHVREIFKRSGFLPADWRGVHR